MFICSAGLFPLGPCPSQIENVYLLCGVFPLGPCPAQIENVYLLYGVFPLGPCPAQIENVYLLCGAFPAGPLPCANRNVYLLCGVFPLSPCPAQIENAQIRSPGAPRESHGRVRVGSSPGQVWSVSISISICPCAVPAIVIFKLDAKTGDPNKIKKHKNLYISRNPNAQHPIWIYRRFASNNFIYVIHAIYYPPINCILTI